MSWCEKKDEENKVELGGEPTFTLRAQDISASAVLQLWITLNHKAPQEKLARANWILEQFRKWPNKKAAD